MTRRRRRRPLLMDQAVIVGRRSIPDVVYAFRFPSRPWALKVGYSSRGLKRIYEQTAGYPEMPEVVLVFHHREAKRIERALHNALSSKQMHGMVGTEWFRAGLDDLVALCPELRTAMGRHVWRSGARWLLALAGLVVWLVFVPLWLALFGSDGWDAVARTLVGWIQAPWSFLSQVVSSVGLLVSGGVSLDVAVPLVLIAVGWLWWSVLRR
jgi:hypothetical protein